MRADPLREQIKKIEAIMMRDKERLAKLRKKLKPQAVADFTLQTLDGKATKLSKLFGNKKELIVVHNMGTGCAYCTLWADGFNGLLPHLENRAAFVVETPNSPKTISAFKKKRGWKFQMVSSEASSFRMAMGYQNKDGDAQPGVSTFIKKGGKIYRLNDTGFGPGDNYCAAWDLFDLLPPSGWGPKFKY